MTTADTPLATDTAIPMEEAPPTGPWAQRWARLESGLDRAGDRMNPILVKEARQAMKSRQFVVTFSLLLIFGWIYTLAFVAFSMPGLIYAPLGSAMLLGYYLILTIPLLIVIPYAAFRSLASEREDGTFELLSITALSARQIVTGKLGSAVLQMMVYYSALAPCIAFTYLLRGVDVVTIGLVLAYTFLASLALCVIGLMLATVTRSGHWLVVLSVVFVMALLAFAVIWDITMTALLIEGDPMPYDDPEFWIANLIVLSFYASFVLLFLMIAAAQLTFATENRSTKIRMVLLAQQTLIVGWWLFGWLQMRDRVGPVDGIMLSMGMAWLGAYWTVVGGFLSGETGELSQRAKRQLPQSLLGRMLLTWFNPGSGTGYTFALLNFGAATALFVGCALIDVVAAAEWRPVFWALAVWGYVAAYLGVARLTVIWARRFTSIGMLPSFLWYICVVLLGAGIPFVLQGFVSWRYETEFEYTLLQLPNWMWTLYEIGNNNWGMTGELSLVVFAVGMVVFLVNLVLAAREVEHVRTAVPKRVIEDEELLHPSQEKAVALSPWDKP